MASSESQREEKEKFFADLYRLDSLDDEIDTGPQWKPIVKPTDGGKKNVQPSASTTLRKRKASSLSCAAQSLPISQTSPAPLTSTVPKPAPTLPLGRPESKQVTTGQPSNSNRARSKKDAKRTKHLELVPEADRIFVGLVFFFVPNNESSPVRKFRIQKAIAHGAIWAREWDNSVTHIIVDSKIHIDNASKEFANREIPHNVSLVRDTWLVECLGYKDIRNVTGTRFRVLGLNTVCISAQAGKTQNLASGAEKDQMHSEQEPDNGAAQTGTHPATIAAGQNRCHGSDVPVMGDELDMIVKELHSTGSVAIGGFLDLSDPSFSEIEIETANIDHPISDQDSAPVCPKENVGFQCMEKNDGHDQNPNAKTIEMLQHMATHYDQMGDHWRTTAYRKGIAALRKQKVHIRTKEEAEAIPGLGPRLAAKIEEIVATNRLRRLESTIADPHDQLLRLFMGIYQVGHRLASQWIAQGHRTLEDIRQNCDLTANQKIGIDHYHDFLQRIPRDEVAQHADMVSRALKSVDDKLEMIVGGSYRRGNVDSGDIDILVTKEGASMDDLGVLMKKSVIPTLMESGFLKATLATANSTSPGSKWHGASALPGSATWRRLDLLFVPWDELGAALIYFTGNDIFNRSLRLLASRKKMRLNQHGLYIDVMRGNGRQKITEGRRLEGHCEKRIFEILGVPYRPPEHRKC